MLYQKLRKNLLGDGEREEHLKKEEHEQRSNGMKEHTASRKHEYEFMWLEHMVYRRLGSKSKKGG